MKSVDTNVLARFVVVDDRAQHLQARRFLDGMREHENPVLVTIAVICELTWVLQRRYGYSKVEVHAIVDGLTTSTMFVVEREAAVTRALAAYRTGKGDLADYLIGEVSRELGADETVTFDRDLRGADGFTVLP